MTATIAEGSSPATRLPFRPDVEGLRAVAVALVVVLHAGVATVSGGYIGVDVFFVVSGFLITSLLLNEAGATGRVSLLAFYARRARRILPAACLVITVTVVAAYLQLGPLVGRTTAIDGRWAAVFAANLRLIRQNTNYFASSLPPSPLQHFWSLAVEEQFYVVWPTLLFGFVLLGRRFSRSTVAVRGGLGLLTAGSLYWSIHQSSVSPTVAYFSPFTRAWELGAGALIATVSVGISRTPAVLRAGATWVGLALVGVAAFTFTAATEFPGYAALLPVVGTAFIIAGGIGAPRGTVGLVLGLPPLRWLGRISYSVYLWHWPVLVIAEERSTTPLSNVARVMCVLITLALSIACYYAVERPLHVGRLLKAAHAHTNWERARRPLLAGAVAVAIAVAVSTYTDSRAVFAIDNASSATAHRASSLTPEASLTPAEQVTRLQAQVRTLVQQVLDLRSVPADVDPPVLQIPTEFDPQYSPCFEGQNETTVRTCSYGAVTSSKVMVVFGDSHALQWMPALDIYARSAGYRLVTVYKADCSIPSLKTFIGFVSHEYTQCTTWRANAIRDIRSMKPAVVILGFGIQNTSLRSFDLASWRTGLKTTVQALVGASARVVEIGDNTYLPQDPGLCLSLHASSPASCGGDFTGRARADAERSVLASSGGSFIDVEPWFCVDDRCPVIIDARIAYANSTHLSPQYVSDLEPLLAASLESVGVH